MLSCFNARSLPALVFEVYQLLRAVGEKYHFSAADDELTMQPQNANPEDELIVAN